MKFDLLNVNSRLDYVNPDLCGERVLGHFCHMGAHLLQRPAKPALFYSRIVCRSDGGDIKFIDP